MQFWERPEKAQNWSDFDLSKNHRKNSTLFRKYWSWDTMFCKQKIIVLHGNYSTDPNNVSSEVKSHIFSIGIGQCTFATFLRNCTICTHTHTQMLPYKIYALMNDFDDICIYEWYERCQCNICTWASAITAAEPKKNKSWRIFHQAAKSYFRYLCCHLWMCVQTATNKQKHIPVISVRSIKRNCFL